MNKKNKKRLWPWIIGSVLLLLGVWQFFANTYKEEEKELRTQIRKTVKEMFPEKAAQFSRKFGLFLFESDRELPREEILARKTVVLIHGLDDPGKVWQNLAPELAKDGYNVLLMEYPNDQPVVESSQLFFEELQELKEFGIDRIAIVAHSMGGLVSREMLTSPEFEYYRSVNENLVPEVARFIMVGTPNHGSQMARFRLFGEVRDHIARLSKDETTWQGAIFDGAGEAKIDLLPESRFLTELNSRSHPDMDMLIIAGITSPWQEDDINGMVDDVRKAVPEDQQELVNDIGEYLIEMTHGLGDGLVTVESTRLQGVPHRTVEGTHLSMIRNVTTSSIRVPPAVPIIIEHLGKGDNQGP
ncbi:MAG: alpha/beta fold hydrolase [Desulfobulbales bacterium]